MAIKIYASDNYVIVEDGANTYEYAKGHTIYTFRDGVYTIKELTQGEYKVTQIQLAASQVLNASSVAYTDETFITFLRQNTGFKTASGGSEATVQNSDLSYNTTVAAGGTLTLPDITVTDSDGSTFTAPSVQDITCTPASAPVGATLMKTGQTTSYRTGDDGDLEAGRATSFTVLASNNPFGNTNRFTDELGGQTYTNNIVIDWSTYNGSNVLGYKRTATNVVSGGWNNAIDTCLATSIGTFTSGWRLANVKEWENILNRELSSPLGYAPFTTFTVAFNSHTSSTYKPVPTVYSWGVNSLGYLSPKDKNENSNCLVVRTFTVTGTTLT